MKRFIMFWAAVLLANTTMMAQKMYITIDGRTESATLVDNAATQTLVAKLQSSPVTVTLDASGALRFGGTGLLVAHE